MADGQWLMGNGCVGDGEGTKGDGLWVCLLYTTEAADEGRGVELGGGRDMKKQKERRTETIKDTIREEE